MSRLIEFLAQNTPPLGTILVGGPPLLLVSWLSLRLAAHLKQARGWKTGYTRKTFHFLTFATATVLQSLPGLGLPITCLFGGMASLVVLHAVWAGAGHPHYEALAREKDAPHRTWYVVVPYLATLLGGLSVNLWSTATAPIGYLVCGLGDAIGEPVGTRWGRHRYRVPLPGRVVSYRSLEGSSAVFLVSSLATILAATAIGEPTSATLVGQALVVGLASALVEAVAPHGWDNLALILVPAVLAGWLGLGASG